MGDESCSLLMDELHQVEDDMKSLFQKMRKHEEPEEVFDVKETELKKKRSEIMERINACQKKWDVVY
jgi:hypothetical protein